MYEKFRNSLIKSSEKRAMEVLRRKIDGVYYMQTSYGQENVTRKYRVTIENGVISSIGHYINWSNGSHGVADEITPMDWGGLMMDSKESYESFES